jgi:3-hydroxyacyl-CoA dehydrogenase/3a,7a,12a-trihydroxy-5b-cholest-24-enoyl-CoA hydratase
MTVSFEGRVAAITGAGGGLGRSYALELASRGAKIVVNDLGGDEFGGGGSTDMANAVVEEIRAAGGEAVANFGDISKYATGTSMAEAAVENFGRLDVLICNAGILRDVSFGKMTEEDWDIIFSVHVKGMFNAVHNAWPHMRAQSYGRIMLTSSTSGVWGNFGQTNYGAAKTAMLGFMNSLKQEGQKYDIKINALTPAAGTRLTATVLTDEWLDKAKPEFVTPLVTYLVSENCPDSGSIYHAGMGRYHRTALMRGPVTEVDTNEIKTAEWMEENWDQISSLENPEAMWDGRTTLADYEAARKK